MPEWIKDILMAIGGGSVVLIGILTIFKQLFIKSFETGMETVFQKNMEKYRDQLSRSTRAYEMILDKEMKFYEKTDSIFAELVPLAHDIKRCFDKEDKFRSLVPLRADQGEVRCKSVATIITVIEVLTS